MIAAAARSWHGRDPLTERVLGAALRVHSALGPGLLESVYELCLAQEFVLQGLAFRKQVPIPIAYEGLNLSCGYRADFVVEEAVLVELKAVDRLISLHEAQVLTYLKLTGLQTGLLINFNAQHLRDGIRRVANTRGALRRSG
jgi:GxxExxY protein